MAEKRVILFALDGSENAQNALNWYFTKWRKDGDELYGFCAWEHAHLATFSLSAPFKLPSDEWQKVVNETIERVNKVKSQFEKACQENKAKGHFKEKNCKPGEGICAAAEEFHAELIVMGTRGLSPLRRTVLGSVSDYVLHHTHIPVAVVPTPPQKPASD